MSRWGSDDSYYWDMDDDHRGVRCATKDCEGFVTFPDLDVYCMDCLHKREQQRQRNEDLYAKAVRRWFGHKSEGDAA